MIGYCMKCKKKKSMKSTKLVTSKGRKYVKGICEMCGTNMSVITK